jgi:hypothetical protein
MLLGENLFLINRTLLTIFFIGDLTRHRRRTVRKFERFCVGQHEQRTTAISERRMCILKRVQLGKLHFHPNSS